MKPRVPSAPSAPTTVSRAFLQRAPQQLRQQQISQLIEDITASVKGAASQGKTSYKITDENYIYHSITSLCIVDEFISLLKKRFPDCDVSYGEKSVNRTSSYLHIISTVVEKSIVIDWS
jgi:hypothetical protein